MITTNLAENANETNLVLHSELVGEIIQEPDCDAAISAL